MMEIENFPFMPVLEETQKEEEKDQVSFISLLKKAHMYSLWEKEKEWDKVAARYKKERSWLDKLDKTLWYSKKRLPSVRFVGRVMEIYVNMGCVEDDVVRIGFLMGHLEWTGGGDKWVYLLNFKDGAIGRGLVGMMTETWEVIETIPLMLTDQQIASVSEWK